MKIFTIPQWDTNTQITHYATTWQIARDAAMSDIILERVEDEEAVNALKVNIQVPSNTVYYVRAKRHLKDANGNVINYDKWLPLLPVLPNSDNSDGSNLLISPYKIEKPTITSIDIDDLHGLSIKLIPYRGTFDHKETIIIFNSNNKEIFRYRTTTDLTDINIPPATFDFTKYSKVDMFIYFADIHDNISYVRKDAFSYVNSLYILEGNLSDVSPYLNQKYRVVNISENNVSVYSAGLYDMDGKIVINPIINSGNEIILPIGDNPNGYLIKGTTYRLAVGVKYIDSEGEEIRDTRNFYLTTQENSYSIYFDEDVVYENKMEIVVENIDDFTKDCTLLTEQNLYGTIPLVEPDNRISLFRYNDNTKLFRKIDESSYSVDSETYLFKFISYGKMLLFIDNNSTIEVQVFDVNIKDETITKTATYTTSLPISAISTNSIHIETNSVIVPYVENNHLVIKRLNYTTGIVSDYDNIAFDNGDDTVTDLIMKSIGDHNFLIIPKGSDNVFSYIYNSNYKRITKSVTVPTEFRNLDLTAFHLLNGDILYLKKVADNSTYDTMIFKRDVPELTTVTNDIQHNTGMKTFINYRSSFIDALIHENNKTAIIRFK